MIEGAHFTNIVMEQELPTEARHVLSPFTQPQKCEDLSEVIEAEKRSHVIKLLRSYYTPVDSNRERYVLDIVETELPRPQHIGSQFGRLLQPSFLASNAQAGLEVLRGLECSTEDQRLFSSTSDEQYGDIWNRINKFFMEKGSFLEGAASERFSEESTNGHENRSAFKYNDRYQFNDRATARSLGALLRNGLGINVDEEGISVLRHAEYERNNQGVPLIELVKNWPILSIAGFSGSKLSLAVHDAVDHLWTFELAYDNGLFTKYDELFKSIGAPHQTDMYKREGEILASISFGSRYWEKQPGFVPLINAGFIASNLASMAEKGMLQERHKRAVSIVEDMVPGSDEYEGLGFVFSNYLVTLHEQRRRYGQIKQRNPETEEMLGELSPLSPDFICFLVELHHEILTAGNERLSSIDYVHATLENYLQDIARGSANPRTPLIFKLLMNVDRSSVSDSSWLKDHRHFSTIKERMAS